MSEDIVGLIMVAIISLGLCSIFGFGFIIPAVLMFKKQERITNNKGTIKLRVLRVIEHYSRSNEGYNPPSYYPVFEFNYNGKIYELKNQTWTHKTKQGDELQIIFNKDNPYEYIIEGDKRNQIIASIFLGSGILILGIGVVTTVFFAVDVLL